MLDRKNVNILYAEDDSSVVEFVKVLFRKNNLTNITFAKDGQEAFELYKQDKFDIVITDMVMPNMNGFELIESVKQINPEQIFIMVTGLDDKEDLIRAIRLRVNFFLEKPIKLKEFISVIDESIVLLEQKIQADKYKELLKEELDTTTKQRDEKEHFLEEYKKAIDNAATFSRTNLDGTITYTNDLFLKVNGFSKDEVIGKSHNILRHPDVPKEFYKELWKTISSKKIWHGVIKNMTKDGHTIYMDTTIIPILDLGKNLVEYVAIRSDVTEIMNLKQEIEDTQKEVVFTMGSIGETRSKETGNHVKRVAEYSALMARLAGLSEEEVELIRMASPMHDIGKVGIPDNILNKPGKLTFEEFETMKTHSQLGYDMLKGSTRPILKTSCIIALEHHEKWDGSGYPNGKKGDDIHIYGRITSICDVFDALGSDRCYKKAWELDKILNMFNEEKGKHFDPNLMDIFLNNLEQFLEIRDRYKD